MFTPLLADDFQWIISLIVVGVGFIGWIFNLVTGKNQTPQPPPRPRPRRPEAREDNIFLEDEPVRRPQQQRPKKPKPQASNKPVPTRSGSRPVGDMADRHIQTSNLGAGVRSHLAEAAVSRLEQSVQQDMAPKVDQSVKEHLGAFTAASQNVGQQLPNRAAQMIVQALRTPASVRQAMIVNTILSPPPGRKPRAPADPK